MMPLPENFTQYGRAKEPKRTHNKQQQGEEAKDGENAPKEKHGYFETFKGKQVTLTLLNGEKLTGTLQTDHYNKFDILLDTVLVPKHAILYIELLREGGKGE